MSKTAKPVVYNDNDKTIVSILKSAPEGMTLSEINAASGSTFVSGNLVSAMKKGLIAALGEKVVERPTTRSISTYSFATADAQMGANGKPFNYTDNEKVVLSAAASIDGDFTLPELAKAMNVEKLSSGSINGLVKKGNIIKTGTRDVEGSTKTTVKVYSFVKDIPADANN